MNGHYKSPINVPYKSQKGLIINPKGRINPPKRLNGYNWFATPQLYRGVFIPLPLPSRENLEKLVDETMMEADNARPTWISGDILLIQEIRLKFIKKTLANTVDIYHINISTVNGRRICFHWQYVPYRLPYIVENVWYPGLYLWRWMKFGRAMRYLTLAKVCVNWFNRQLVTSSSLREFVFLTFQENRKSSWESQDFYRCVRHLSPKHA